MNKLPFYMADKAAEQPSSDHQPDRTKLVKITPAEEAQQAQKLSSKSTDSEDSAKYSAHHRYKPCWKHHLYNSNPKLFPGFDKNMPCVGFALFKSKLEQCQISTNKTLKNALALCLPNDVFIV